MPIGLEVSAEDAADYADACNAWESGEYTDVEMAEEHPGISRSNACEWVIVGYTVQQSITVEELWIQLVALIERLYIHVDVLERNINNMYKVSQEVNAVILAE